MRFLHPRLASQLLPISVFMLLVACSPSDQPESASVGSPPAPTTEDLETSVARMAAIGYSYGASFAPDGERIVFISSSAGVPQAWIAAPDGSGLEQLTHFEDQVGGALWSPANNQLAVSVAPGGGLNTQIYLVSAAGGDPEMITAGGQVNNWLTEWSRDGRYLMYSSNIASTGGMDCYRHDTETGESHLIASNQGAPAAETNTERSSHRQDH